MDFFVYDIRDGQDWKRTKKKNLMLIVSSFNPSIVAGCVPMNLELSYHVPLMSDAIRFTMT